MSRQYPSNIICHIILHNNKIMLSKVISTMATPLITQLHFYFASFLARAPRHRSSTCHHRLTHIVPLHNDTNGDELVDHLSLSEQLIGM
jgi:hypothetical protein